MPFHVEVVTSVWEPSTTEELGHLLGTNSEFVEATKSQSHVPKQLSQCSPIVRKRLESWTSDLRKFSQSVLPHARGNSLSNAYMLGSIVSREGFLNSGLGARPVNSLTSEVPNQAHAFRLQWHRALLNQKISKEVKLTPEELDKLTILHCLQTLHDIVKLVSKDTNFLTQPERYPNLSKLKRMVEK